MNKDTLALWEIMVPCNYNDGTPVKTKHHKYWDRKVREITGGLTIMKPAKGQWLDKGILYEDKVIPVRIACIEDHIDEIIKLTLYHYDQVAVMAYMISNNVKIFNRKVLRNPDKWHRKRLTT
jgi:hypothetical protein